MEPAGPATLAKVTCLATPPARPRPAVGYVCVFDDEDVVNGLHGRLTGHAERAGLDLVEVYVDRPASADDGDRPGLHLAIDEIARHPEALLLVPDLSHLPTAAAGRVVFDEQYATVVTEIHALDAHPAPVAGAGRARLTAEGTFEVMVEPDDDVAGVIATLRQLPAAARFLEALGDVETTLVFLPAPLPTKGSGPLGDPMPFAYAVPTGSTGRELVGLTADDLADRLHAALAGMSLGPQDECVLTWLATQTAERALTISSLLRRARARAA
ncbi:hypothetical protein BCD48_37790 [Pseudofrankia sp. BMG5.36]|nr:hypothetical protein BCD48_37790 [Pseudofrankia sp. BMG5.36]